MTFSEKFEQLKKKYYKKADTTKLKDSFIAAQITMSDEDCGGTFYVAYINSVLSFEPYDYHDNTVALIVNSVLLEDCISGKADPAKAYLDGRLQAWGNLDHALQLIECLKGKKKESAKKTKNAPEEVKAEEQPKKRTCKRKTAKTEEIITEKITSDEEVKEEKKPAAKKSPAKKKNAKE